MNSKTAKALVSKLPRGKSKLDQVNGAPHLGVDTVKDDPVVLLERQVVGARDLGEAPLAAGDDLLPARELELGTSQSLNGLQTGTRMRSQENRRDKIAFLSGGRSG